MTKRRFQLLPFVVFIVFFLGACAKDIDEHSPGGKSGRVHEKAAEARPLAPSLEESAESKPDGSPAALGERKREDPETPVAVKSGDRDEFAGEEESPFTLKKELASTRKRSPGIVLGKEPRTAPPPIRGMEERSPKRKARGYRPSGAPRLKAGRSDDNEQFGYFLKFMDENKGMSGVRWVDVSERYIV